MYTLEEKQMESVENFINSLPDSIVKGNYERWLNEVPHNRRIDGSQMEKFLSFAHALPVEFQNYPQHFAHAIKNGIEVEGEEVVEEKTSKAKSKKK